ncbi:hypothetical protein HOC14_00260, partial [bacterium]|nr:hypothetical protein [bacterium]
MSPTEKFLPAYIILVIVFLLSLWAITRNNLDWENINTNYQITETTRFAAPDYVRAIYLTAYSAGRNEWRQNLIEKMKDSRINSVVIDIKDYSGFILYDSQVPAVLEINAVRSRIDDIKNIIKEFHQAGIYVIARQTVFQDPKLASAKPELAFKTWNGNIWRDYKGLAWLDPQKEEVWEYNLAIAKEATKLGFDEINFDYMRYPSDGNVANMNYNLKPEQNRAEIMKGFYKFLSKNLSKKTIISIDMFGLVMDHTNDNYDLHIGQRLTDAVDYFDYVYPMMYASHYPVNYLGLGNAAAYPGAVLTYGLKISLPAIENKKAKIRPWLQAFNIGAIYDQRLIDQQIDAVENATSTAGWALWNARNYYPDYI